MEHQVVLVTGGSSGIGRAAAVAAGQTGARVYVLARKEPDLSGTCEQIRAAGGRCAAIRADVSRYEEMAGAIRRICDQAGRVDVLINSAGVAPLATMIDYDVADFDTLVDVNIRGVFYATRAVWPVMAGQKSGCIINISSLAAVDPFPGFQAYGASKAWVNAFTAALAEEGRPHGIRVYAVAPGAVETPLLRSRFPDYPAGKCLSAEDVARTVSWLLDERAVHASGSILTIKRS